MLWAAASDPILWLREGLLHFVEFFGLGANAREHDHLLARWYGHSNHHSSDHSRSQGRREPF